MSRSRMLLLVASMLAMFSLSVAGISAQDATPAASPAAGGSMTHPAHIHAGTCDELDPNPAFPLTSLMQIESSDVAMSTTTLDVSIEDILAAPHAINVHESPENVANYVACGNVEGPVVDGKLVIGLSELNDSGIAGVAVLESNDAGGTDVTAYVVYGLAD